MDQWIIGHTSLAEGPTVLASVSIHWRMTTDQ